MNPFQNSIKNIISVVSRLVRNERGYVQHFFRPRVDYIIFIRLLFLKVVEFKNYSEGYRKGQYVKESKNIVNNNIEQGLEYLILRNCRVTCSNILITQKDEFVIKDSGFGWLDLVWKIKKHIQNRSDLIRFVINPISFLTQNPVRCSGKSMIIGKKGHFYNYWHFLLEYLPTLRVFDNQQISELEYTVVVPDNCPRFVFDYFQIANSDVKYKSTNLNAKTHIFDELLVCERRYFHNKRQTITSAEIQYIRDLLLDEIQSDIQSDIKRDNIIISRRDTSGRNIMNLNELVTELKSFDFDVVTFSDKSIEEQVNIIRCAQNIITPQGSNITNTIYADDVNIICVSQDKFTPSLFGDIAIELGNNYENIVVREIDGDLFITSDQMSEIKRILNKEFT